MKRMTYSTFGAAGDVLSLSEAETPTPDIGEVLVKLKYSGVNPSDVKVRAGGRPGVTAPAFPQITPHSDGAGVVEAVGTGVPKDMVGKRVWIWNGQWNRPFGTAATHIVLPATQAVPLPDDVPLEVGACLGIPGLTASHTVFGSGDVRGKTVLIQGAAGTVGHVALQLARWGGARVIATARMADHARCLEAGAHAVVDFTDPEAAEKILQENNGKPVDRIIEPEFGVNVQTDTEVIAPDGVIAAYGSARETTPEVPFMAMMFKNITLDMTLVYILPPDRRSIAISRLYSALRDGALEFPVDTIFSLSDCAKAHEAVERGGRKGAILLDVTQ